MKFCVFVTSYQSPSSPPVFLASTRPHLSGRACWSYLRQTHKKTAEREETRRKGRTKVMRQSLAVQAWHRTGFKCESVYASLHILRENVCMFAPMTRMLLSCSTPSILDSSWLTTVSWTPVLPAMLPRCLQMASISSNMMMWRPLLAPSCSPTQTQRRKINV